MMKDVSRACRQAVIHRIFLCSAPCLAAVAAAVTAGPAHLEVTAP